MHAANGDGHGSGVGADALDNFVMVFDKDIRRKILVEELIARHGHQVDPERQDLVMINDVFAVGPTG